MTRVALTQPSPRVERIAATLRARGHEVAVLSTRRLEALPFGPELAEVLELEQWAVLVSPGAVDTALDLLGGRWPESVGIGVIGPGSALALAAHGIAPPRYRIVQPSQPPYDADALLRLAPFREPAGLRLVVLRGERGRTDWIERLREQGARVSALSLYRSVAIEAAAGELDALERWRREQAAGVFVFTSADGIDGAEAALAARGCLDWARGRPAFAVHPKLVRRLQASGWSDPRDLAPGEPALVAAIESV